jgi:hypothetical protein
LGDKLSLLLFLQVQGWRTLEPLAVLAAAGLALACFELPKRGPTGLLGLAFLAAAWMFRDSGDLGLLAAPVGLMFVLVGDKMRFRKPALFSGVALGLLAVAVLAYGALRGVALAAALERMPGAWPFSQGFVWSSDLPSLAIALVGGLWLAKGWKAPHVALQVAAVVVIGVLATILWDDRSAFVRQRDRGRNTDLVAMTAWKPGEVLWMSGDVEPWALMGRPSWSSKVQSAGVVFSRPLALELAKRAERLKAAGLAGDDWMRVLMVAAERTPPPSPEKLHAFCAAKDAPAWIVWPRWDDEKVPLDRSARDWTPRSPFVQDLTDASGSAWRTAKSYAVIPCAGG